MGIHERLWGSVIIQAMADIEEGKRMEYYEVHRPRALKARSITKRKEIAEYAQDARDWLDSYDSDMGSFQWICDSCGFDADRLREMSYTAGGRRHFLKADRKATDTEEGTEE